MDLEVQEFKNIEEKFINLEFYVSFKLIDDKLQIILKNDKKYGMFDLLIYKDDKKYQLICNNPWLDIVNNKLEISEGYNVYDEKNILLIDNIIDNDKYFHYLYDDKIDKFYYLKTIIKSNILNSFTKEIMPIKFCITFKGDKWNDEEIIENYQKLLLSLNTPMRDWNEFVRSQILFEKLKS